MSATPLQLYFPTANRFTGLSRTAMSNPNGLLGQKSYRCLN